MKFLQLFLLLSLVFSTLSCSQGSDNSPEKAFHNGRYMEGTALSKDLLTNGKARPEDYYWAGLCYLRMHCFEESENSLTEAWKYGFSGPPGGPPTQKLLGRLKTISGLTPSVRQINYPGLFVHAGAPTAWTGQVLSSLPEFVSIGQKIFGQSVPDVNFFLFSDCKDYSDFYNAVFAREPANALKDATPGTRMVLVCEDLSEHRGQLETIGNVLHEFGHAWANTYLRIKYDKEYSNLEAPWNAEGLAQLVADQWDKGRTDRRKDWIQRAKVSKGISPPPFAELQTHANFYDHGDVFFHYCLGGLLFRRLLGPEGVGKIPAYLDALAETGDSNKAWIKMSGLDPAREYDALIQELWHRSPP